MFLVPVLTIASVYAFYRICFNSGFMPSSWSLQQQRQSSSSSSANQHHSSSSSGRRRRRHQHQQQATQESDNNNSSSSVGWRRFIPSWCGFPPLFRSRRRRDRDSGGRRNGRHDTQSATSQHQGFNHAPGHARNLLSNLLAPRPPAFSLTKSTWHIEENHLEGRNGFFVAQPITGWIQLKNIKNDAWWDEELEPSRQDAGNKRNSNTTTTTTTTTTETTPLSLAQVNIFNENEENDSDLPPPAYEDANVNLSDVDDSFEAPPSRDAAAMSTSSLEEITRPTPPKKVLVTIHHENEEPVDADVQYDSKGRYTINFTIMTTGEHIIQCRVQHNGVYKHIGSSHTYFTSTPGKSIIVQPGPIDASQCVMKNFHYQPHIISEQYSCEIETYDAHGNKRETGGEVEKFSARFVNDARDFSSVLFQDLQNGRFSMIYMLPQPGIFQLEILFEGIPCFSKQTPLICCAVNQTLNQELSLLQTQRLGVFQPRVIDGQKRKSVYLRVSSRQISLKKYVNLYFVELFPKTLFSSRIHRVKLKFINPDVLVMQDGIHKVKIKDKDALKIAALILKFRFESGETFSEKQKFFKSTLLKECPPISTTNVVKLARDKMVADASRHFLKAQSRFWRSHLQFRIRREEGIDAGGLYREVFHVLCSRLFATDSSAHTDIPSPPLFRKYDNGFIFFDEAASSRQSKDLLSLAGKITAKMLYDYILIDKRGSQLPPVSLSPLFFKHLLQLPVEAEDLQYSSHASLYKHFMEMDLDNEEIRGMLGDPTFTVEQIVYTTPTSRGSNSTPLTPTPQVKSIPLIPGGERQIVTNSNKEYYLGLLAQYELYERVQPQVDAFLAGFYSILPQESLAQFDPEDINLLMCGVTEIDVNEMRENCDARTYMFSLSNPKEFEWFWKAVSTLSSVQKSKLLGFITGSTTLPAGGFAALNPKLKIQMIRSVDSLPRSHTCFHILDLPRYSSYQKLLQCLNTAIEYGSEGFGMQ